MARFILERLNPLKAAVNRGQVVRVSAEAYRELVVMATESRQSLMAVASQALIYAAGQVEYKDEE